MSFILSKILWPLAKPGNLLLVLLAVSILLARFGRGRMARSGRWLLTGAGALLLAVAVLPLGSWLLLPLENRFPQPSVPPAEVAGIIVLGGAVQPDITAGRGQPALNHAAERMTAFVALARRYPSARLIFSGGHGSLLPGAMMEADVARLLFESLGLDAARVVFERESRNTWENAIRSRALIRPAEGESWLLVTSAAHMPRAVGIFRRIGWPVTAWPVDYRTQPGGAGGARFDFAANLGQFDDAVREWIGLVAYRAMGRTGALLPRP